MDTAVRGKMEDPGVFYGAGDINGDGGGLFIFLKSGIFDDLHVFPVVPGHDEGREDADAEKKKAEADNSKQH